MKDDSFDVPETLIVLAKASQSLQLLYLNIVLRKVEIILNISFNLTSLIVGFLPN